MERKEFQFNGGFKGMIEKYTDEEIREFSGARYPYIPYMAEELVYLDEIYHKINTDSLEGKLLRWYVNRR